LQRGRMRPRTSSGNNESDYHPRAGRSSQPQPQSFIEERSPSILPLVGERGKWKKRRCRRGGDRSSLHVKPEGNRLSFRIHDAEGGVSEFEKEERTRAAIRKEIGGPVQCHGGSRDDRERRKKFLKKTREQTVASYRRRTRCRIRPQVRTGDRCLPWPEKRFARPKANTEDPHRAATVVNNKGKRDRRAVDAAWVGQRREKIGVVSRSTA